MDVVTRALVAAGLDGGLQIVYKIRPLMQYVTIEPEIGHSKIPRIRYSAILRGNHGFEFTFSLEDIYNIKKAGTGQE